ncbi:MAG: GIY-YIG nuclease family protein [Ginsengibacter sp.]
MYFIYILYSVSSDKYYVGYSSNPHRRLEEHNSKPFNTFTSKFRPWKPAAYFKCSENEGDAIRIERFIKKQKSRKLLQLLCDPSFLPEGNLAQLVRVPHMPESPVHTGLIIPHVRDVQVGEEEQPQ